jgi:hypothetical protein
MDERDLRLQILLACFHFGGKRRAILGRAALNRVPDEDMRAFDADLVEHVRQKLPAASHERTSLSVFFRAWTLADEHDLGVGSAFAWHGIRATGMQRALPTLGDLGVELSE